MQPHQRSKLNFRFNFKTSGITQSTDKNFKFIQCKLFAHDGTFKWPHLPLIDLLQEKSF